MRRGVSWAEDLTETISTPPDDDDVKKDFINDANDDEDDDENIIKFETKTLHSR